MSLLKKLAGLAVGAAAVGAVAYVLQNREHHDDEYEHIWGSEDEVEPETDSAEPADDASAVAEPAPAAAPEVPAVPAGEEKGRLMAASWVLIAVALIVDGLARRTLTRS